MNRLLFDYINKAIYNNSFKHNIHWRIGQNKQTTYKSTFNHYLQNKI